MKIWLIALPLMCAASVAMADSTAGEAPVYQPEPVAAPHAGPAHYRMARHGARRLPSGDIRDCLAFQTNAAIIRCAEKQRKR